MRISTRGGPLIQPLPKPVRQIWLVLHVVCSVGWIGVEVAVLTLYLADRHEAATLLANGFFLPTTLLVLVTGVVLGIGTKWGLFRYYWVISKLVIALIVTGIALVTDSAAPGLFGVFLSATALFVVALALSILKPWGRIRVTTRVRPQGSS